MKKTVHFLLRLRFLIAVAVVFLAADVFLSVWAPVERYDLFTKNDFEKTVLSHGGKAEFNKVIYGNSVIISAFIEEESSSGYVNLGLDYGTVADLRDMLEKGIVRVNGEIVLALNYFVLLDTLDTNPTYPWHRKFFEPYLYFQRDRISRFIRDGVVSLLSGSPLKRYPGLEKSVYYGVMTDEELNEKIRTHRELFWGLDTSYYKKNLAALRDVIDFCRERGIRLRAVWMPWNGYAEMPENPARAVKMADDILRAENVEVLDLTNSLPRDCFYDLGHLNYERGARVFTEKIDKWLAS